MLSSMNPIGKRIHTLRQAKDWTLADLSKRSGVALSSLSRMETGQMTGTLESHVRIARALGVRLVELYADLDSSLPAVEARLQSMETVSWTTDKGIRMTPLTGGSLRKKMFPVLVSLKPGKSSLVEQGPAGAEGFLYVLKGKLELTVGKQPVRLEPGNSAYFQASYPSVLKNVGSLPALALRITSPPML